MHALKICSVIALALMLMAMGNSVIADTSIYAGKPAAEMGLVLGSWGSGSAQEDTEKALAGGKSIKIDTGGWFQGGSIGFKSPVSLFTGKPGAGEYLVFVVAPTMTPGLSTDAPDAPWYLKSSGSSSKNYDFGAEAIQKPKIQRMRFVFLDDKGKRTEVQQTLTPYSDEEPGWMNVSIPLTKLKLSPAATEYGLKKIFVFSDSPDIINIGAIKILQDSKPLGAEVAGEFSYAAGDSVPFRASVTAGLSSVKCAWDFDSKDGIQEDAVGQYATHVYAVAGDYVVTLAVTDDNGIKSPFTKTVKVHIE